MKLFVSSIYFLLPLMVLMTVLVAGQSEDAGDANQLESSGEENRSGRFVRYAKHPSRDSINIRANAKAKSLDDSEKDEKICGRAKEESGTKLNSFGWLKSFLHRENRHHDDSETLRKVENKKAEKFNEEEVDEIEEAEDDYNANADESDFDGREDFGDDEHVKVARSAETPFLDPGSSEVCEEGNCKGNSNSGQDRALGFMDSAAGNSKKTSNIALKAAQEAKAAEDAQETAGKEASKQAKFQLAEKAIQAAKAAQAALSAKQSIVDQMERELRESEVVVQDLSQSIQASETNANAAMRAAQQAAAQLKMLTEAIQSAQGNLGNSEQAAQGAQQELSEKTQLLEAAKNRVELLLREMKTARADYANTKQAAYRAASAAKSAKANASRVRRHNELMQKINKYMQDRYQ